MNKKVVPIVFTFDNNFFVPAVVTFYSMLKNAHEDTFYDIFIMADLEKFNSENKEDLNQFERTYSTQCKINYIDMKGFGNDFAILDSRFNFSVYYRLFIHNYIDKYDKVIFSDVDIVILKDLYEVYSTDISDCYLGAIRQTKVNALSKNEYKEYINKAATIKQGNYFNAGFLLVNLSKIRQDNYNDEFRQLAKKGFNNNDQDILNLVFENKVKYIPLKYCYMPIDTYFNDIKKSKLLEFHPEVEIEEYKHDPAIIHYLSTKPWNVDKLEAVEGFELDKFQLWWDTFHECLDFINKKAVYQLYARLNKNILTLGDQYCKEQTIFNTFLRLISLISKLLGVHKFLKSIEAKISR